MRRFTTASLALTIAATGILRRRRRGRRPGRSRSRRSASSPTSARSTTATSTSTPGKAPWHGAEAIGAPAPQFAISQTSADIAPNIQAFVDQDYDIIVTVGFAAGGTPSSPPRPIRTSSSSASTRHPASTRRATRRHVRLRRRPGGARCRTSRASTGASSSPATWPASWPPPSARPATSAPSAAPCVIPAVPNYIEGYANGARSRSTRTST